MIRNLATGLLSDWNLMRWLRLVLGIYIAVQAIQTGDAFAGTLAAFLLWQVVTNTGCCGTQGCAAPMDKGTRTDLEKVQFEEVTPEQK